MNYRGVKKATLISVLEGDGKNVPFEIIDYVLVETIGGDPVTYGKVVKLSPEEQN